MAKAALDDVLAAWRLSGELGQAEPPASDGDLRRAEQVLGRRLPPAIVRLYAAVGGGSFAGGNLTLHPAVPEVDNGEGLSLATAADLLRTWGWPVPEPLVVFGDNGAGDAFGVWVPRDGAGSPVVVQLGEVFEERCLAVVGDDLPSFLCGWTAYYLLLADEGSDVSDALDALGVPPSLRSLEEDGSDDEFFRLLRWASPNLPDPQPDPYERGLTAEQVDAITRR